MAEREAARLKLELEAARGAKPLKLPVPENYAVSKVGAATWISWRWGHWGHVFIVGVLTTWAVMIGKAFALGEVVSPVLQTAFAAPLLYLAVAFVANRTRIEACAHRVVVQHGPVPVGGKVVLARDEIRQLFVREIVKKDHEDRSSTTVYDLCAVLANGRERRLVKEIPHPHHAVFLERELERAMGIASIPVEGEVRYGSGQM